MKNLTTKNKLITCVTLLCLIFIQSCRKDILLPSKGANPLTIAEAKSYFENNFQKSVKTKNIMSIDASGKASVIQQSPMDGKMPMWDASILKKLAIGTNAVLAPMHKEGLYVHISEKRMVKFGFLNYMMMYKNEKDSIITEWVELRPTEKWIDAKFSREYDGEILARNWNGKIKKVYSFANGVLVSTSKAKINKLASINGSTMDSGTGGDINCFVTTTTTITTIPAKPCPCEGHTYGQVCNCNKPPTNGGRTIKVVVEYDCDIPDGPTGGTGSTSSTGQTGSPNNPGGGGSPSPNDYPPLNCNPDPEYTIPVIPPPPGTEYVLSCSSIAIPTDPPPPIDPVVPETSAQMLINWFNSDSNVQLHLSVVEATFLNDNPLIANELLAYLNSETREVKEFGKWAVGYLTTNNNKSIEQLDNDYDPI